MDTFKVPEGLVSPEENTLETPRKKPEASKETSAKKNKNPFVPSKDGPGKATVTPEFSGKRIARKLAFYRAAFFIVLLAGIISSVWLMLANESTEKDYQEKMQVLQKSSQETIDQQGVALLRLSAIPLSWAIGPKLIEPGAYDLNQYVDPLAKEKFVVRVMIADLEGVIQASSDRKFEGEQLNKLYPEVSQNPQEEIFVKNLPNEEVLLWVPLNNIQTRLGTLALVYSIHAPETTSAP